MTAVVKNYNGNAFEQKRQEPEQKFNPELVREIRLYLPTSSEKLGKTFVSLGKRV